MQPFLRRKIMVPRLSRTYVPRPELLARIEIGASLIVVSAPLGYGKTATLADFSRSHATAWYTLDPTDRDHNQFAFYLSATLNLAACQMLTALERVLSSHPPPALPEWLILDAFDLLEGSPSEAWLNSWLLGPLPKPKIVLVGRRLPGISAIALFTALGKLEALGADQLRFTVPQIATLLSHYGQDPSSAASLHALHGGWVASLLHGIDPARGATWTLPPAEAAVNDLAPDLIQFVRRTAILDVIDEPTCNALLGAGPWLKFMDQLRLAGLLQPVSTPSRSGWAYPPPLRSAMRKQLPTPFQPDQIAWTRLIQADASQAVFLAISQDSGWALEQALEAIWRHGRPWPEGLLAALEQFETHGNVPAVLRLAQGELLTSQQRYRALDLLAQSQSLYRMRGNLQGVERAQRAMLVAQSQPGLPVLEVFGFGPGRVLCNGIEVVPSLWQTAHARELFFYLVEHPEGASGEHLANLLWSNAQGSDARDALRMTILRIRKAMGHTQAVVQDSSSGNYQLGIRPVRYDVQQFERLLALAAQSSPASRVLNLKQAVQLYQAPWLQAYHAEWMRLRRASLQRQATDALLSLAQLQAGQEAWAEADCCAAQALAHDPALEAAYRLRMQAAARRQDQAALRELYQVCIAALHALDLEPSATTQALFDQLLAGMQHA